MMSIVGILFSFALALCGGWLMAAPKQSLLVRLIMAAIVAGAISDIARLIWYGDIDVWPGELLARAGGVALLVQLVYRHEKALLQIGRTNRSKQSDQQPVRRGE
jgi:hypothetical protein